jgi:hypothetical protein
MTRRGEFSQTSVSSTYTGTRGVCTFRRSEIMKKWKSALVGAAVVAALASSSSLFAATGAFTSPLTNAFLSVDINGGIIASNNATTEGSNGPSASPTVSPDQYGVTWSPWGGPVSTNGDGIQLPDSQATPPVFGSSITKAFGGITATISEAGTAANYAQGGGGPTMNSRDRGTPSGAALDGDLFRDLLFAGGNGSNVQSTNYLQVSLTGLAPSTTYQIALYSFDTTGAHSMNWTATAPSSNLQNGDHLGYNPNPTNVFTAPADEQTITWTGGTATPAPAVFSVTSDATGALSVYGWGGNGVTGNQSSDTSYINGFQISVPEPASMGMLAVASLGLLGRRRNKTA